MSYDHEIEASVKPLHITKIAQKLDISDDDFEPIGKFKAKIAPLSKPSDSNLILVTATNPTPFGEGKTTVTIGLSDGLAAIGKKVCAALREPSLGPVFGMKGGATGGGRSQVTPSEEINLHFTGDFHAITSANNLISAMIDNHMHHGNTLNIEPNSVSHKRCLDMNDRTLRQIKIGLEKTNRVQRDDGFIITAASEIMAILCLAADMNDLKERVGRMIVAFNVQGEPVYARDLGCVGAVCTLLKDAMKPNLIQTLEGTPVLMHGGPFANIAHGCNSIIATKTALNLADFVVTEAGFAAELGAQKFLDIKCRAAGIAPKAVVLVTTIRSLKHNGGVQKEAINEPNLSALKDGAQNLLGHIENLKNWGQKIVVALNKFATDDESEIAFIADICEQAGVKFSVCEGFLKGSQGTLDLARKVVQIIENNAQNEIKFTYDDADDVRTKIEKIATKIYGAKEVKFSPQAQADMERISRLGFGSLPVCIAKTPYSFSSDAALLGRARGFIFEVNALELRAGAGFVVAVSGATMLMPGLPKHPHAMDMEA